MNHSFPTATVWLRSCFVVRPPLVWVPKSQRRKSSRDLRDEDTTFVLVPILPQDRERPLLVFRTSLDRRRVVPCHIWEKPSSKKVTPKNIPVVDRRIRMKLQV